MPNILTEAGAESAGPFLHVAVFVVHDDDYLVFGSKPFDALTFDAITFDARTFDARMFDIPARSMHATQVAQCIDRSDCRAFYACCGARGA